MTSKHKYKLLLSYFFSLLYAEMDFSLDKNSHPSLIIYEKEGEMINKSIDSYPLLKHTFDNLLREVNNAIKSPIEIPMPGEAGGYAHEKHKQNYRDMRNAGELFVITGEVKYANFVKTMLLGYSDLYPNLGPHPMAKHQKPGKLFHQMLNEAVWLTNVSIAYDCIYNWLDNDSRIKFEKNIFSPMVSWFTGRNKQEFDKIHNHGMWACAAIGLYGIVIRDMELVKMALYGTKKDGSSGFLKQLDELFSPDGYYMEGPYYVRYTIRPLLKFAEALERNIPKLKIYEYRGKIVKKAYYSAVNTTFPNGIFFPINDASKTMDIRAPGMVFGNSIINHRYENDQNLLKLCEIQGKVLLNESGYITAKAYSKLDSNYKLSLKSIEYSDGKDGNQGGLGILRMGQGDEQSVLIMKYGVHGMGHGHFDKLHFIYFDQNKEIINDYGFSRWVNVEPKFGGRYLPENDSYAKSTVAHNTVVVNMINQNQGNRKKADTVHGVRHYFYGEDEKVKIMSAKSYEHYPNVTMQRTMLFIDDDKLEFPVVLDVFRLESNKSNTYDYPIHYSGQIINTNFKYEKHISSMKALGSDNGYEHIWEEANGEVDKPLKITWLDGQKYYSIIASVDKKSEIIFGRIGANDPKYNLRSEPMFIFRKVAKDYVFASVVETHGYFNEASESSRNTVGYIEKVIVVGHNKDATVIEVEGNNDLHWQIIISNNDSNKSKKNKTRINDKLYFWVGDYSVELS